MKTENIGSVPICEDRHGKKLLGIVTDRDLALQVVAENRDASSTSGAGCNDARALDVSRGRRLAERPRCDGEAAGETHSRDR
jgi:hypothetical protein